MQSLILSPLRLVANSLLILVAWDWGQAAIRLEGSPRACCHPCTGKATWICSCPKVLWDHVGDDLALGLAVQLWGL